MAQEACVYAGYAISRWRTIVSPRHKACRRRHQLVCVLMSVSVQLCMLWRRGDVDSEWVEELRWVAERRYSRTIHQSAASKVALCGRVMYHHRHCRLHH